MKNFDDTKIKSLASLYRADVYRGMQLDLVISQITKKRAEVQKEVDRLQNLLNHPYHQELDKYLAYIEEVKKNPQTFEDKLKYNYYNDRRDEFKDDLIAYYDVWDNPKVDIAYDQAWGRGHSAGYYEVAQIFGDLVDLIR